MANFNAYSENYLYPTAFKFTLARIPSVTFHCQSANIPGLTIGVLTSNNPRAGRTLKIPSQNLQFEDLQITFLIDETMENWLEIYNWMQALRVVENWNTVRPFVTDITTGTTQSQLDTGTVSILNSANNVVKTFRFHNLFPSELSSVAFTANAQGTEVLVATVTFPFEYYTIDNTA
jgi:hypothetical protein